MTAGPSEALFTVAQESEGIFRLRIATDREPYLGPAWAAGFAQSLDRLRGIGEARALVLVGGDRAFSKGAARESLLAPGAGPSGIEDYGGRAVRALLELPIPVVAAMAGHAVGGGLLLGLWCDALVLARESLYGANFMALGFTPGMGATHAVPEMFGPVLGRELLLTGRLLTGREIRAAGCPLSHAVRPRDEVRAAALALAREMTAAPREAQTLLKRTLARPRMEALERALASERSDHARLFSNPETVRAISGRYPRRGGPDAERGGEP